MLAIRLQRRGRKGLSQFRVILQDSHRSPFSGKVTAYLGSYDPHSKTAQLDAEKIEYYLNHGAQPSSRAATLFKAEGIKLPKWVVIEKKAKSDTKNPEKLRKNQPDKPAEKPAEEKPADVEEKPVEEKPADTEEKIQTSEESTGSDSKDSDKKTEEPKAETSTEEKTDNSAQDSEPSAEPESESKDK